MFRRMKAIVPIVKDCMNVRRGQHVLIVTDDCARSIKISQQVAETCGQEGAEVVMAIMEPRTHHGHEPPPSIAEAMQAAEIVFHVADTYDISHTDAAMRFRETGRKFVVAMAQFAEEYYDRDISIDDLKRIKERTDRLAEMLTGAGEAQVTTPFGTDIRMSLRERTGISLHPLGNSVIIAVPDYAEATISPVEGSTEGTLVVDSSVQGWNFLLREPLHLTINSGKVTEVRGPEDYAVRLRELLDMDENASNCAAELGIGTSHTMPADLKGVIWDYGTAGTLHVAAGRNNDIGGTTHSLFHKDLLLTRATVLLDDLCVLKDGQLLV